MARVIAVEEDPSATEVLQGLRLLGHDVLVFPDVISALEAIPESRPDLVLLDWGMLDMGALEAMRELESRQLRHALRVVLVSARMAEADILAAYQAGFDAVVAERASATELDEAITSVLLASRETLERRRRDEVRKARLLVAIEEESER